jgi:hypothetical protein
MADNRELSGGVRSAGANLKKIDEEIAAPRAPEAPSAAPRLTKTQALDRYGALRDSVLGFAPHTDRARKLARIASPEELKAFSRATEHLSWPESFGQTPWECASVIGWGLRFEEEHPGQTHWAHDTLEAYRSERREVEAAHAPQRAPTLYIYHTGCGEAAGQIVDVDGKSLCGIAGCSDANEVITAATEQGYERLGIARVARLEDVPGFGGRPREPEGVLRRTGSSSRRRSRSPARGQER